MFLLVIWVGPVSFVQTDAWQIEALGGAPRQAGAAAQISPDVIPPGRALFLDPGTYLELRLKDGTRLAGRYFGRALLDSATYAPRFEARSRTSSYAPFALGETLRVVLRDGREWTKPFAGYAEQSLLLRGPDGPLRVPFEFAKLIQRAGGEEVDTRALSPAFHDGLLPSAEALTLEVGRSRATVERVVAIEDITWAAASMPSGGNPVGVILASAIAGAALLLVVIAVGLHSATKGCGSVPMAAHPPGVIGARLTTRAFDRCRACFVGDPLTVAGSWPGADAQPATPATPDAAAPCAAAAPAPDAAAR